MGVTPHTHHAVEILDASSDSTCLAARDTLAARRHCLQVHMYRSLSHSTRVYIQIMQLKSSMRALTAHVLQLATHSQPADTVFRYTCIVLSLTQSGCYTCTLCSCDNKLAACTERAVLHRPNTDTFYSHSTTTILTDTPANVLRPPGIAELLREYPNRRFVDTLLSIALSGARVGFEGLPSGQTRQPNHKSAYMHSDVISKSIESELAKGRIKEVTELPFNYFCSPIGLTPKSSDGLQTGWRVIFDLSSPEGLSVNDGIPKEYGTIAYETLQDAIRLVAQAGKGAILMKRDLKSAFRHIPINPCDHWLLLFEWQGKFYVDMFLPFGLRTAPRIFNFFAEALHWVFETLNEWNVTHYLDDFLFVFPPSTDTSPVSTEFDRILAKFGFSKATEKDSDGCVVVHLGFEFDTNKMQVTLPPNKRQRAIDAVDGLLSSPKITINALESTLGFLSHCCQVVPIGRPFLRHLFSLLCRCTERHRFRTIRIPHAAKEDLRWWQSFLQSWSSISMIQPSRTIHDVATDASGTKGLGGVYQRHVFSERTPARHRSKHIHWKEMFAVLHAFLLWHDCWRGGLVRLACDNTVVVDAVNKHSIKGLTIRPLQSILLIAAVYDINLTAFWIPSEVNTVADAASRHDYEKLANLGLQVSHRQPTIKISTLRQKLSSFFTTPSRQQRDSHTTQQNLPTSPSVESTSTLPFQHPSKQLHTGWLKSCGPQNQLPLRNTSMLYAPSTSSLASPSQSSMTLGSISSSGVPNDFTERVPNEYDFPLQPQSSSALSTKSHSMKKVSTSKQRSVWHLPPSYDLENLRGIHGPQNIISSTSLASTLHSTPTVL